MQPLSSFKPAHNYLQELKNDTRFIQSKFNGNYVKSCIILRENQDDKTSLELEISTQKSSSGVWYTRAQVSHVKPSDCGKYATRTCTLYEDYNFVMLTHPNVKRGTEKAIVTAHKLAMDAALDKVLDGVSQQYNLGLIK